LRRRLLFGKERNRCGGTEGMPQLTRLREVAGSRREKGRAASPEKNCNLCDARLGKRKRRNSATRRKGNLIAISVEKFQRKW